MHFIDYYVTQIPIPKKVIDKASLQQPIVTVVSQIRDITRDEDYHSDLTKHRKVVALMNEIDRLVYELYGLSDDEVRYLVGNRSPEENNSLLQQA